MCLQKEGWGRGGRGERSPEGRGKGTENREERSTQIESKNDRKRERRREERWMDGWIDT